MLSVHSLPGARAAPVLSVGMVTYSTRPRGSVVCAAALAEALYALGVDVTLYALDKGEGGFYRSVSCPLVLIPTQPASLPTAALIAQRIDETRQYFVRTQPSHMLIHVQDCLVANGVLRARHKRYHPFVVRTVHHVERFDDAYLQSCQRRSILNSDGLITVSHATRRHVESSFARRASVIYNGVDLNPPGDLPHLPTRGTEQVVGFDGARFLLSVGGIEPRKNSLTQLQAFIQVRERMPELRWVIVGGASVFDHAQTRALFWQQAERAKIAESIVMLGFVDDAKLACLYRSCAAFLHAAHLEGWGLSVMEALRAGAPVVVSRGPPFDEYVDDACAVRVNAASPESIASGVFTALNSPLSMRNAAKERAESFTWERSAAAHLDLYRNLLQRPTTSFLEV